MTAIKLQQSVFNELSLASLRIWKRHCKDITLWKYVRQRYLGKCISLERYKGFVFSWKKWIPKEIKIINSYTVILSFFFQGANPQNFPVYKQVHHCIFIIRFNREVNHPWKPRNMPNNLRVFLCVKFQKILVNNIPLHPCKRQYFHLVSVSPCVK